MNPRDIVYVDASGLATWNRLINLILPTFNFIKDGTYTVKYIQDIHNAGWK